MTKNIVAIGGGGLINAPDQLLLEKYVLSLTGKARPSVLFLPTASADPTTYVLSFYTAFSQLDCRMSVLNLYAPPTADLESFILEKDAVYVGGGNTKTMLATWREWHLDDIFRKAWEKGVVLSGVSAGMICWFEQGLTDSIPGPYTALRCLGFLPGSASPHYDGEINRRPRFQELIGSGEMMAGLAADDGAALHYVDRELKQIVSSRPNARGYAVSKQGDRVQETVLDVKYLGDANR